MSKEVEKITSEFIESSCYRMDESLRMIRKSFELLDEEDLWKRPNPASNSMGNLLLHLQGNIRQYIISSLGGARDIRERDKEFEAEQGPDGATLLMGLANTILEAKACMWKSTTEELLRKRKVQGFNLSGIGIIVHVVEHLSYHTGQIAFYTKQLKNRDLGYYHGTDLNIKNP